MTKKKQETEEEIITKPLYGNGGDGIHKFNKLNFDQDIIKKYLEIKKQFDDLIFEIVKTRTLNYSEEINSLVKQISPQIEKINNLLEEKKIRS